jgi:hypothetical protein
MQPIDWIVLTVIVINAIVGIVLYKKSNILIQLLSTYFVVQAILEIWSDILLMKRTNNQFLYHFFVPILFLILSYLFFIKIYEPNIKKWLLVSSFTLVGACWFFAFSIQSIREINSYAHLLTRLVLCIWVVLYFRQLLQVEEYQPLKTNNMFWISLAVLLHIANYCFYGIVNVMLNYNGKLASAWYTNILLIDIGFYCVLSIPLYRVLLTRQ